MWQIDNRTPFAAAQGWVRDRDGAEVWLVVVKATFDVLRDGSVAPSAVQPQPVRAPEYYGPPGESSIRRDSDFVLTKCTTDVLVDGDAHAPGGRPVEELDIGFRVGPMRKLLRVFGDRRWGSFGKSAPEPFAQMPIVYERAYGGVDPRSSRPERDWEWRNPVGTGYATSAANALDLALPNVEAGDRLIANWDDRPEPAGFGPVASHWQPRAGLAGTYDAQWEADRQPLLPLDCDDRFFQCAPADQQAASFLAGGEQVTVLNMSSSGRLDFRLPEPSFSMVTTFGDGEYRTHLPPKLHTLIVEPGLSRFSMVWHSALECHAKVYKLDATRIDWRCEPLDADSRESVEDLRDLL